MAKRGLLPPMLRGMVRVSAGSQRQKGWLLARLAAAAEADRGQVLRDTVRAQVAIALGHGSPEEVELEASFPELGFDSLASLEMRDWVNVATGLQLSASALFDYPSIESLAAHVEQRLDGAVAAAASDSAGLDRGNGTRPSAEAVSIGELYERAATLGRMEEGGALLAIAARLRPSFDLDSYAEHVPRPVRLSSGPVLPRLICVPSILAVAGPHQYVGLAQHFAGGREVVVVPNPGFLEGEALPDSTEAAIALQAAAIRQCAAGEPYVLLGHSTAGLFAHALAEHLDGLGESPAGLIKVDTYPMGAIAPIVPALLAGMNERGGSRSALTDQRLTAMAAYRGFLDEFEPESTRAAGLLVRAADPMPGMPPEAAGQVRWEGAAAVIDVPGDHFTMMEEHVAHVAEAVEGWLGETFPEGAPVQAI
jgi:thioesterase domain-containing protein/acyl carrier protein